MIETVPSYLSVLVHYDPLQATQAEILAALPEVPPSAQTEPRHWVFPACFDGDFAPDLAYVADWAGCTPEAVIDEMLAATQVVYMLGFAPGQPYLGDLPDHLALPRRKSPVPRVERGSILIATGKTVIYSVVNPTGWYVIGRTPVPLFEAASETVLLAPGDRISFRRVARADYDEIEAQLLSGANPRDMLA